VSSSTPDEGAAEPSETDADQPQADAEQSAVDAPQPKRRRATTPHPPGSDPTPLPEPPRGTGTENDDRLKADKPPHY